MWPFSSSSCDAVANVKQEQRKRALGNIQDRDVSAEQSPCLRATASEIVERIQKGEWTASQVLEAFIERSKLAQLKTNCITEVMFDWAKERAGELDEEFALTGQLRGPLHGVPISIKDQYDVIGFDTSIGFSQWTNKPATTNADPVNMLLEAGAVPFVKTNVPQTMFAFECRNPVWGRTLNPYHEGYTCGGSSGGEAALLAMDGSALGLGSDIGGSLRIPTAYCGIYSMKPAHGRLSYAGAHGPVAGFEGIKTVAGPMARSVKDLTLFSRITFGVQGRDHDVPPVPFQEVKLQPKLRFGYYTADGIVKASPACQRAVIKTVDALRKQGHECIEFELPGSLEAGSIFVGLASADGYKTMLSHLGPDPKENALFLVTLGPKLPGLIRSLAAWAVETFVGDKIFSGVLRESGVKPVDEYLKLVDRRNKLTRSFYQQVWDKYNFDGIIGPVQALPQLPHGGCDNFSVLAIATILYNVLDMPVGCLPVTRVDAEKDGITESWTKEGGHGSQIMEGGIYYGKKPLYNPVETQGMPVNVQVVGKKWEEEKVLAMMGVVDEALGTRGFGPGSWDTYMDSRKTKT